MRDSAPIVQRVSAIPLCHPSLALATAIFLSWVGPPRPLWGEVEPGPFTVGFRVSRGTSQLKRDPLGGST